MFIEVGETDAGHDLAQGAARRPADGGVDRPQLRPAVVELAVRTDGQGALVVCRIPGIAGGVVAARGTPLQHVG